MEIYVYYKNSDSFIGTVYVDSIRNRETYSFEYSEYALLHNLRNIIIDEEIAFVGGRQFKQKSDVPYRFLLDSMPDRWGRNLIKRKYKEKRLFEVDYLLSVSDISRMGALRYKNNKEGEFLSKSKDIPSLEYINTIEDLAYNYDDFSNDDAIKILINSGSSMGGARPKATIYDNDNNLYLAKFTHKNDEYDVSKVEYLTYLLLKKCEINVSESKIIPIDDRRSVFLTKRFDRNSEERTHYVSFMTLLGADDGDSNKYTYLDIVEKIIEMSSDVQNDLLELYKRLVFYVLLHNYDDHLRNIGMIYENGKWRLSPCFDVNITLYRGDLTISLDGINPNTVDTLINNHDYFRIDKSLAESIVNKTKEVINSELIINAKKIKIDSSVLKHIEELLFK